MALATYGMFMTKGVHWMWNFGGVEYIAFWGIASLVLAVHAWKEVVKVEKGIDRCTRLITFKKNACGRASVRRLFCFEVAVLQADGKPNAHYAE